MPAIRLYYSTFQGTVKLTIFNFLCIFYLCEKYYKPITVLYCVADFVSWVPRLTLLDLPTN